MSKRLLLTACALGALTSLAVAQTTPPAQPGSGAATQPTTPPPAGSTPPASTAPGASGGGQAAQPGLRTVDPTTVAVTFYTVQSADMLASNLMGLDVHNLQNEEIGEIEDLIIDNGKSIRAVVVSVGGFLGIGERRVAVQPASIVITREGAGNLKAVVNTTRENLKNAPEFKFENNMARSKR
jgi:sporulation protein YlmC with PRC-barrel domain